MSPKPAKPSSLPTLTGDYPSRPANHRQFNRGELATIGPAGLRCRPVDMEGLDTYSVSRTLRGTCCYSVLGVWEQLNNPGSNPIEFDGVKEQARLNSFIQTARQWIEKTSAIGITSQAGRYGGADTHENIPVDSMHMALVQGDRLKRLNAIAIRQMQTLTASDGLRRLAPPKGREK